MSFHDLDVCPYDLELLQHFTSHVFKHWQTLSEIE